MYDNYSFNGPTEEKTYVTKENANALLLKSFLYMFIGLLITAVVSIAVALPLGLAFKDAIVNNNAQKVEDLTTIFYAIMIVCGIGVIIMTFVNQFVFLKGRHSLWVPFIIYTVLMGGLISSLVLFLDWETLALALGITVVAFGIMTLIGVLSKGNMNIYLIAGLSLLFSCMILSLLLWILSMVRPGSIGVLYWVVTFGFLAAIMLLTIWDIHNIKRMGESGISNKNVPLYCALVLYSDFIYIFIRIALILAKLKKN